MPGFVYAQGPKDAIYVNLYVSSETTFDGGGKNVDLSVDERDAVGRQVDDHRLRPQTARKARIKLRIPGWARNQPVPGGLYSYATRATAQAELSSTATRVAATPDGSGYVSLDRMWKNGDVDRDRVPDRVRRSSPTHA